MAVPSHAGGTAPWYYAAGDRLSGMVKFYRLFGRGVKWSYKKYGLKGAVAFVAVAGLAYYLVSSRLDDLFTGDEETAA